MDKQSPALGFLSVVLAFMGISDLVSLSMPEEVCLIYYWGAQGLSAHTHTSPSFPSKYLPWPRALTTRNPAHLPSNTTAPLRACLSMAILLYTYIAGPGSPFYQHDTSRGRLAHPSSYNPSYVPAGWGGDMLKNRVLFTFIFLEMASWFWAWLTLREERYALVQTLRAKTMREED